MIIVRGSLFRLLLMSFLFIGVCPMSAQRLMLKTNTLGWFTMTPNLGLEARLSRHNTLNLEAYATPAHYKQYRWKHVTFTPEVRHWFSARPQARHFVGVMGLGSVYNMMLKKNVHEGMALGAGITYGYSMVLSQHWGLEFTAGAGYLYRREKEYPRMEQPVADINRHKSSFSPLKAGVTLVYIFK